MDFFVNKEDLSGWVRNQKSGDEAASKILDLIGKDKELDVTETCKAIYEKEDDNASSVLFGVLAQHNLTSVKKTSSIEVDKKIEKQAQAQSRQRNGWERGMRNKWNRVVDGYNEGTPWRVDRDKFYNFTHYYTDALSFDADPTRVYSGEAIWRMYIMDKFTREYQNKDGKWVGGYINDRFHVFPTAGTPSNPDAPRDGGNQMGLPPGIKTRKPRPHQYSVERRLEEARGAKTVDLEAFSSNVNQIVKIASKSDPERENDKVYSMFKDVLDMREAGIDYETMLESVSDHYGTSILNVAQIDRVAQKIKTKHSGIAYESGMTKTAGGWGRFSGDLWDVLSAVVMQNKGKTALEISGIIKNDPSLVNFMKEENMNDEELTNLIMDAKMIYAKSSKNIKVAQANPIAQTQKKNNIVPNGNYVVSNPQGVKSKEGQILPKDTDLIATQIPGQFVISYHPSAEVLNNKTVTLENLQATDLVPSGSEVGLLENETTQSNAQNPQNTKLQPEQPEQPQQPDFPIEENNISNAAIGEQTI